MALRPRPHVRALHRVRNAGGRLGRVRLDKNEHTEGLPPDVVRAILSDIGPDRLATYPELDVFYAKLAAHLGVAPGQVLVTAGSDAGIKAMYEVFVAPGDEVLLLQPTYAMFHVYAGLFEAKMVAAPYADDLSLDLDALLALIHSRVSLVAIANPNSPTATTIAPAALRTIVEKAAACDTVVLMDEAYFPFHDETMIGEIRRYPNLAVTRTFSKAYGLAALRIGYAVGPAPVLNAARSAAIPLSVTDAARVAAIA